MLCGERKRIGGTVSFRVFRRPASFLTRGKGGSRRRPLVCRSSHKLNKELAALRGEESEWRHRVLIARAASTRGHFLSSLFSSCFFLHESWCTPQTYEALGWDKASTPIFTPIKWRKTRQKQGERMTHILPLLRLGKLSVVESRRAPTFSPMNTAVVHGSSHRKLCPPQARLEQAREQAPPSTPRKPEVHTRRNTQRNSLRLAPVCC